MTLTLNNIGVTQGRLTLPAWGIWWADLSLTEPAELSGKVTLKEQDAELKGTIISGGVSGGGASYRIVGGNAGWRKEIKAKGYQNAAGCTFSSVANELASEVGETLENPPRTALGPHYARRGSAGFTKVRAADVLSQHFPRAWHVGDDGVTRFVARKGAAFKDPQATIEPATELGMIRVNADYGTQLRPGITIDGVTIGNVDLFYGAKRVIAYCYPENGVPTDLVGQIAERVLARTKFLGCYEYKCNDCDSAYLLNLEPTDSTLGLPSLDKVAQRSPAGFRSNVDGGTVVLMFVNGNPARPVVIGAAEGDENDSSLVVLGAAGEADFVALAQKVDDMGKANKQFTSDVSAKLDSFQSWGSTHTHQIAGVMAGPATLPTTPPLGPPPSTTVPAPNLESVAASNVKAS